MRLPLLSGFDPDAVRKYFKNTAWLIFGKLLSLILGFVVARYLGPSHFGAFAFAMAFVALFMSLSPLGLDSVVIQRLVTDPAKRDEWLGTAFWMRMAASMLLAPLCVLAYVLLYDSFFQTQGILIALCVSAYFFKPFQVIDLYFQSRVASRYVVQVQNVSVVLSTLLKVMIVILKLPVVYFAIALIVDSGLMAAGLWMVYAKQTLNPRRWYFTGRSARSMFAQSWPLMLSAAMVSLYMQIDQVMLKSLGTEAVGIYSAAARLSESWYFIPVAIVTSIFPALIYARQTDIHRYKKRLQHLYDLLVLISLPIALVTSIASEPIIRMLYGNQYEEAAFMLSIHIWSGIFVFLGSASSQYLLVEGYTSVSLMRTALGALTNVLLNLWLIPLYGGVGASVATLLSYFTATFSIFLFPHTREQGMMMLKSLILIPRIRKF